MSNVIDPLARLAKKASGLRGGSVQKLRQTAEDQLIEVAFIRYHTVELGGKRLAIPHHGTRGDFQIYRYVGRLPMEMQFDKLPSITTIFVHEGQWHRQGRWLLWTIGGQAMRQPSRQSTHGRRPIGRVQENIEHVRLSLVGKGF